MGRFEHSQTGRLGPKRNGLAQRQRAATGFVLLATLLAGGCEEGATSTARSPLADTEPASLAIETTSRPWPLRYTAGQVISTPHYRIYTTSRNTRLLEQFPAFMEAAHARYLRLTGLDERADKNPKVIYLMGTQREWLDLTRHVIGRDVPVSAGGYCYEKTCFFWDVGIRRTFSVGAHEGMHQFFRHRLVDPLPMWLEEGLCTLCEGYRIERGSVRFAVGSNHGRARDLARAITSDYWLPLRRLLAMHSMEAMELGVAERVVAYYGQLWALTQRLLSDPDSRRGLEALLADAQRGTLHEALGMSRQRFDRLRRDGLRVNREISIPLFRHYIDEDLDRFEEEFRRFAIQTAQLE